MVTSYHPMNLPVTGFSTANPLLGKVVPTDLFIPPPPENHAKNTIVHTPLSFIRTTTKIIPKETIL